MRGGERMAQDERLTPATNDRNRWLGPPVSPAAGHDDGGSR